MLLIIAAIVLIVLSANILIARKRRQPAGIHFLGHDPVYELS